jgi:hypothetical protein
MLGPHDVILIPSICYALAGVLADWQGSGAYTGASDMRH